MSKHLEKLAVFQCFRLKRLKPDQEVLRFVATDGSFEALTYQKIYEQTNRMTRVLMDAGVGKGDRFAIILRNHPEFVYALFAAMSLGAVAVPIDPRSKGHKLAFQIKNTSCKLVLTEVDFLQALIDILPDIPDVKIPGVVRKAHHSTPLPDGYQDMADLLAEASPQMPAGLPPFKSRRPLQVIHTSGTTGDPKGIVSDASRLQAYEVMARLIFRYKKNDVLYTGLSLTHGNAQGVTLFPALALSRKGVRAVISERFTKRQIWDICRKHNCTSFSLLGGMMSGIFNEPPRADDGNNPIRKVISAGTPQPIWKAFEERFKTRIHEWYGAMEGGMAHNPPGKGPVGSFGKPHPLIYRMKIVDENDREVAPGVKGELISRMRFGRTSVEYLGKKEASKDKVRGGWLRSGDICHKDKKGFLYFDYRKGGGLRRQGDFIQPEMVEKVIGAHPTVSEVAVYGIPAESGAPGESDLVAAVTSFEGGEVDLEGVIAHCRESLEANSVPSWFQVVPEIPKTASEKPLTRILKEEFRPEAAHSV